MSWNRALPYGTRDKLFGESRQMTETAYKMMAFFIRRDIVRLKRRHLSIKMFFQEGAKNVNKGSINFLMIEVVR